MSERASERTHEVIGKTVGDEVVQVLARVATECTEFPGPLSALSNRFVRQLLSGNYTQVLVNSELETTPGFEPRAAAIERALLDLSGFNILGTWHIGQNVTRIINPERLASMASETTGLFTEAELAELDELAENLVLETTN